MPSLLLVGSGPGIASSTATLFATKHFTRIALISRSVERLPLDKASILSALQKSGKDVSDIEIDIWNVDVKDTEKYKQVLSEVGEKYADLSCVIFNPARVNFSTLFEFGEDEIMEDFKTTNIALYTTARFVVPILQSRKPSDKPSFLVTSSLLAATPYPSMFSLSMMKASQWNLVQSLSLSYPDIHFAMLNVMGQVSVDSKDLNPTKVAEEYWELYNQEKSAWTFERKVPFSSSSSS